MNSPGELRAYFENIVNEHKLLKQFFYGDYDQVMEAERSNMEYPLLWLEGVEIKPNDEDSPNLSYDFAFVILQNSPADDKQRELFNHEQTFRIAMQVISRLRKDSSEEIMEFDIDDLSMYPVNTIGNDNDQGWRVEIKLTAYTTICYDSDQWNGRHIGIAKIHGHLDDDSLFFDNISESELDTEFEFRYKVDDNDFEIVENNKLVLDPKFKKIYVELAVWASGSPEDKIYASIFANEGFTDGYSVPFRYNPF